MRLEETYFDARNFYTKEAAEAYDSNSRIQNIQKAMTERALELLNLQEGKILDAGCGSGISTKTLLNNGFEVIGIDISKPMIEIAQKKKLPCEVGDFRKLNFEDEEFDAIISISAIQWAPGKDIHDVFDSYRNTAKEFYRVLKHNTKAVLQFYPKNKDDLELILKAFKVFDKVDLAIDNENTKSEKKYLILQKF